MHCGPSIVVVNPSIWAKCDAWLGAHGEDSFRSRVGSDAYGLREDGDDEARDVRMKSS
jgi:hypothetical protein